MPNVSINTIVMMSLLFQFKKRALVHFAVDTDEVFMTTRLQGAKTRYLPFNKGCDKGKGNPVNPKGGHKTAYLWEEVFAKDSWMDILRPIRAFGD